jgi:hypothetical protein
VFCAPLQLIFFATKKKGETIRIIGAMKDITGKKESQRSIATKRRAIQGRFQRLCSRYGTNKQRRLIHCKNTGLTKILGYNNF